MEEDDSEGEEEGEEEEGTLEVLDFDDDEEEDEDVEDWTMICKLQLVFCLMAKSQEGWNLFCTFLFNIYGIMLIWLKLVIYLMAGLKLAIYLIFIKLSILKAYRS